MVLEFLLRVTYGADDVPEAVRDDGVSVLLVQQVDPLRVKLDLCRGPLGTSAHGIAGVVLGARRCLDGRQESIIVTISDSSKGGTPLMHAAARRYFTLGQHHLFELHLFFLLFLSECFVDLLDFSFDDCDLNARRKLRVWSLKVTRWHGTLHVEDLVALLLLTKL